MIDVSEKIRRTEYFIQKYESHIRECRLCPRNCGTDRAKETGECGEPFLPRIASANLHQGEEPPISGQKGSGTVFFSGCNLHCAFCQNFPISQYHKAQMELEIEKLSEKFLELQNRGAHNINFVTPSHQTLSMVMALSLAYEKGLNLPVVYNTSAYDLPEVIRDLEGIVDIYLPDAKYSNNDLAVKYSCAPGYTGINRKVLKEMFRQKGTELICDENGIALSGMIIRHLVLPGHKENSLKVLKWISESLSTDIHLSIMSQYFPAYRVNKAPEFESINRSVDRHDYEEVLDYAENLGLYRGWWQDPELTGGA